MPTSGERKALWFFAVVALSGSAARVWRSDAPDASPGLDGQLRRVDSARAAHAAHTTSRHERATRAVRATRVDTVALRAPLDLDQASAAEIERLPGIGPALAARIVANRDSAGPFGDVEALCAVRGVGPALVQQLRSDVTFSGARRPVSGACDGGSKTPRNARASRHRK